MKTIKSLTILSFICLTVSTLFADDHESAPTAAIAVLQPTEGYEAEGTITFTKTDEGVHVEGSISGLEPGEHGFHVHEYGDISSKDGTSAGGHFNPSGEKHGGPNDEMRHAGDFGNITAGDDGVAKVDFVDKHITLEGAKSILGRGLVVHAKADDLESQPSGAAGPRVATAVIGVDQAE